MFLSVLVRLCLGSVSLCPFCLFLMVSVRFCLSLSVFVRFCWFFSVSVSISYGSTPRNISALIWTLSKCPWIPPLPSPSPCVYRLLWGTFFQAQKPKIKKENLAYGRHWLSWRVRLKALCKKLNKACFCPVLSGSVRVFFCYWTFLSISFLFWPLLSVFFLHLVIFLVSVLQFTHTHMYMLRDSVSSSVPPCLFLSV